MLYNGKADEKTQEIKGFLSSEFEKILNYYIIINKKQIKVLTKIIYYDSILHEKQLSQIINTT